MSGVQAEHHSSEILDQSSSDYGTSACIWQEGGLAKGLVHTTNGHSSPKGNLYSTLYIRVFPLGLAWRRAWDILWFLYILFTVCLHSHECMSRHTREGWEDNLQEPVRSHHASLRDRIQVTGLGKSTFIWWAISMGCVAFPPLCASCVFVCVCP